MIHILLLFLFINLISTFKFNINQNQQNTCDVPLITQYYSNYKIPLDDIDKLIKNLTGIKIDDTTNKTNAILSNISATFSYPQTQRIINQISQTQVSVQNDGFNIKLSYNAQIQKRTSKKRYQVITYIDYVPTNYIKKFSIKQNFYNVTNVSYNLDPSKFNITYKQDPTDQEKKSIQVATKTDLYSNLDKVINSLQQWLNDAANQQHISQTYISSPYNYKFNQFNAKINVQSLIVKEQKDVLQNGLKGILDIQNQSCPQSIQQPLDNYHTFYSRQFMMNMAQKTVQDYINYKNVQISSQTAKSKIFQFRVIDLQYIVSNVLNKYPSYYLKQIYFICQLNSIYQTNIQQVNKRVSMDAQWACKGYINTLQAQDIIVLDFSVLLSHKLKIFVLQNNLKVYVDSIILKQSQFNAVDDFVVINKNLADIYIKQMFNSLYGYTIGSQFKIRKGSMDAKLIETGLWIG